MSSSSVGETGVFEISVITGASFVEVDSIPFTKTSSISHCADVPPPVPDEVY